MLQDAAVPEGPVWVQHVIWLLGYPETWLFVAMWVLIVVAVASLAMHLRRTAGALSASALIGVFAMLVAGYVWLFIQTRLGLVEGDLSLAGAMGSANSGVILAALASAAWLVMRRARR